LKIELAGQELILKKACLIEYVGKARFRITKRGREVLSHKPSKITAKFLMQFPEFVEFQTIKKSEKRDNSQEEIN
jgi:restriction system protein